MMELNENEIPYRADIERLAGMTNQQISDELERLTEEAIEKMDIGLSSFPNSPIWKKYLAITKWVKRSYPHGLI